MILNDREAIEESYTTAYEVLLQLGEEIPGQFAGMETKAMVKETAGMVKDLTEDTLLGMRELEYAKRGARGLSPETRRSESPRDPRPARLRR